MKQKSNTRQKYKPDLEEFERRSREAGFKLTKQRRRIFEIIAEGENHPSVEEIYEKVHRHIPSISLDTVYRTVSTFERIGLVHRFQASDGRYRYDTNLEEHHHLICTHCGRIEDVNWAELNSLRIPRTPGWQSIKLGPVALYGLCPDCR